MAPRAQIGNYRIFNVPSPVGHVGNTPEIVAAFESAVTDGMDVINFSGGGPQTDPATDALVEAVRNVVAAGVVPVISSGNDRDDYGLGSAGSPGTAPDAISVAALSNSHVYAQSLGVTAPGAPGPLTHIPFVRTPGPRTPAVWATTDQPLVDVGTIVGTNGAPVPRDLCGPPGNLDGGASPLPAGSLNGAIALVSRGTCTFALKGERVKAAGGIGIVVVDNRSSEANPIPLQLAVPGGMIADIDGAALRSYLAGRAGRAPIRVGNDTEELVTGRSGVVTSFSSAGLTAFGHLLKPDLGAPGGQILSSTLPLAGGPFAVFDGTSMAAPHVAGAAALLLQRHPNWTPHQVKSALMSTAAAAWADSARTVEAPVILSGAGLVDLPAANDPKLFTDPVSLSFTDLNVFGGRPASKTLLLSAIDAGDGAGAWSVEVRPQSQSQGVELVVPGAVVIAPGGDVQMPVTARAAAGATTGEAYGMILLRRGERRPEGPVRDARHAARPRQCPGPAAPAVRDRRHPQGHLARVRLPLPRRRLRPGAELHRRARQRERRGAAVPDPARQAGGQRRRGGDRLVGRTRSSTRGCSGRADENDVQGYSGTPVNVNNLTIDYPLDIGAAGVGLPAHEDVLRRGGFRARRLHRPLPRGCVRPPGLGRRRAAAAPRADHESRGGRTADARVAGARRGRRRRSVLARDRLRAGADRGVGVRPGVRDRALRAAAAGAEAEGRPAGSRGLRGRLPGVEERRHARRRAPAEHRVRVRKDHRRQRPGHHVARAGGSRVRARTDDASGASPARRPRSARSGSSTAASRSRRIERGGEGIYSAVWKRGGAAKGEHTLRAIVTDAKGRKAEAQRIARVC